MPATALFGVPQFCPGTRDIRAYRSVCKPVEECRRRTSAASCLKRHPTREPMAGAHVQPEMYIPRLAAAALLTAAMASAQPVVLAAGYAAPYPIKVAPGQLL